MPHKPLYAMWEPTTSPDVQERRIKLLAKKIQGLQSELKGGQFIECNINKKREVTVKLDNITITRKGKALTNQQILEILVTECEQEVAKKREKHGMPEADTDSKAAEKAVAKAARAARAARARATKTTGINKLFPKIGRAQRKVGHNLEKKNHKIGGIG